MIKILIGVLAGLIMGGTGVAVAETSTQPADPGWMRVPCATTDYFKSSNCYWDSETMGTQRDWPDFFVHTFKAQRIRCYIYTTPQALQAGDFRDHCVSTGTRDRSIGSWSPAFPKH